MIYLKSWETKENYQPRTLYLTKLFFKSEREIKTFSDKQKLREIINTKKPDKKC